MSTKIEPSIFENQEQIQSFICPNCQQIDLQPLIINCKHFICRDCFEKDSQCKECQKDWEKKILFMKSNVYDQFKIICPECVWKGTVIEYQQHKQSHQQNNDENNDSLQQIQELKYMLQSLTKEKSKQKEKNEKLISELKEKNSKISNLLNQIKYLKSELYDNDVVTEQHIVEKKIAPSSINVENFVENLVGYTQESIKRKIIADYFNPRSVLIEENYELTFPFKFTFHVKNFQYFQNEIGFLIYDQYQPIGKISLTKKRCDLKLKDLKHYLNLDVHLKNDCKVEFECNKNQGKLIVNDKKLKNIYENKTFYYGGDYKFKPFVYYHFATPSNGREFLVL